MVGRLHKLAQWAQTVEQCRDSGLSVRQWCQERCVNVSSYYKLQRKVYAIAQSQQENRFVEVTPAQPVFSDSVAVTVRIAGAEAERFTTEPTGCTLPAVMSTGNPSIFI